MTGKFLRLYVRGILVLVAAMPVWAAEKITFLHVNDVYEISPWEISPRPGLAGLAQLMSLLKAERAVNRSFPAVIRSPAVRPAPKP